MDTRRKFKKKTWFDIYFLFRAIQHYSKFRSFNEMLADECVGRKNGLSQNYSLDLSLLEILTFHSNSTVSSHKCS